MDKEQKIRLDFLNEAEVYFDNLESNLLGLADTKLNPQQVDIVLRSAHSIKGGAAMMGFATLSQIAHCLEDFLKILRVRYTHSQITTEVENLLLQGVDCLRDVSKLNRQGIEVKDSDFRDRTQPIFEQLRHHLGDLKAEDEDALMAQDEAVDPALLVFEEGVDTVLDRLENQLKELGIEEIAQQLNITAQELIGFGNLAKLESFTQLSQSIQEQVATVSQSQISSLADRALKAWRRSHGLVLLGRIEKLPSRLEDNDRGMVAGNGVSYRKISPLSLELKSDNLPYPASPAEAVGGKDDLVNQDYSSIPNSESVTREVVEANFLEAEYDLLADNALDVSELQSAFDNLEIENEVDFDLLANDFGDVSELRSAFDLESSQKKQTTIKLNTQESFISLPPQKTPSVDKMVRVPASQLQQFNNLFEELILNRNTINLRLQQLENVITLMSQRMSQMESSNTQLKQWYDSALIEGFLTNKEPLSQNLVSALPSNYNFSPSKLLRDRFDNLEMDRYSDIHLICQEQIETLVQLQEVATDLKLGLQEMNQAVRDLDYTTKSMQGNVNRTQMLPFAEAVKRFPRVIRDLSSQFNKQVNLKIIGENTLLDRSVIEALSDPLMHLLRNAFDHGIETPKTRIAAGKPESGTITIQASNQGTYTVITIADDGGGISLEKIRERVVEMGISPSEVTKIPEAELLNFIFEPGFSTAQKVTELSGRGVGMDVVKTNLQEVRGDVQVTTKLGQGTTFTLRVPFTLSILRVAVIEQAGIIFAIPAHSIRELIPIKSPTKNIVWNQTEIPLVEIQKTLVYRRSRNNFNLTGNPLIDQTMALVIGDEPSLAAIQISRFWYEQESTIRPIDSPLPLPPGIISSVVLGDGKVVPLADPILLIEECLKNNSTEDQSIQNLTATPNLSTIKTILVVDDSINVRRYLSLTLEKAGYRVEQAKDGQEAIDKLLGGLFVQAVICDLEMPQLDGYGVLEEIKERAEFAHLPIAMLTSRSNEKHQKLAMNLGASAYLSKPYNEQELLEKLAELLYNSH